MDQVSDALCFLLSFLLNFANLKRRISRRFSTIFALPYKSSKKGDTPRNKFSRQLGFQRSKRSLNFWIKKGERAKNLFIGQNSLCLVNVPVNYALSFTVIKDNTLHFTFLIENNTSSKND